MLKEIGHVFSFLTIFPSSNTTLENIAKYMYTFPIVGISIGLLIGLFGFGLSSVLEDASVLVGLLVVTSIVIVTGIHHIDGLADFSDGLMVKGSKEKKIKAMKDLSTGTAGTVGVVLYLIGMVVTISMTGGFELFKAILISEILAKFSMVLLASIGKSAYPGSGTPFVNVMKDKKNLVISSLFVLFPVLIIGETAGLLMLGTVVIVNLLLMIISARSFGGITGDVLGTANELSRLTSLMVFVLI